MHIIRVVIEQNVSTWNIRGEAVAGYAVYSRNRYDLEEAKRLAVQQCQENGLAEYRISRFDGSETVISLEETVDLSEVAQGDEAEAVINHELFRFKGWNGHIFAEREQIAHIQHSLAYSPLFEALLSVGDMIIYRRKAISKAA